MVKHPKPLQVMKRGGYLEDVNLEKIQKLTRWACEGLTGVSPSEVEIKSQIEFYDRISTKDIHESLIKSAALLITEDTPNYQYVGGRLINFALRKEAYGQYEPPKLYDHIVNILNTTKLYDPALLDMYTKEEWEQIDRMIDHDRDLDLTYVAMEQFRGKYLVQNRSTNKYVETPQIAYILIAAILFSTYPKETRLSYVRQYYDAMSQHYLTVATPILAGVRTREKQYASCVLIETGDDLNSIASTATAVIKYVSQRAGIGIGAGRIRANKSPVAGGLKTHTGVVPFYKLFQAAIGSCSQGGVRKGSGTVHFPMWHYDFHDLVVLKNSKGTEETRVRNMDYSVQLNKVMYERLLTGGNITLFSPEEVPELYEAFFIDNDKFRELYVAAENNPNLRKRVFSAAEMFDRLEIERKETGRVYIMNVDHCNTHSSFIAHIAAIRQSNLCQEITLPTDPLFLDDPDTEIATCILSAMNWGKIREPSEFEKYCDLAVRSLDQIIDLQQYPLIQAENAAKRRRTIGVGICNLAYWLAKNGFTYDNVTDEALVELDRWAQSWSYYLIKASVNLAREKGFGCEKFNETKYSLGILPIDTYKKDAVDELVPYVEYHDWQSLRQDILTYKMMNSTLMAGMPVETSSQVANATNGVDPPRAIVSIKGNGNEAMPQVVPEPRKLKNKYNFMWDQRSPKGYLKIMAILQKYMDQAISANTNYNSKHYENGAIPMSVLLEDVVFAYKYGLKTLYYNNTNDDAGEIDVSAVTNQQQQQSTVDAYDESCESCVL